MPRGGGYVEAPVGEDFEEEAGTVEDVNDAHTTPRAVFERKRTEEQFLVGVSEKGILHGEPPYKGKGTISFYTGVAGCKARGLKSTDERGPGGRGESPA